MIADYLRVSAATVSKALSGQTGISEDMRNRVKLVAQQLGYSQKTPQQKNLQTTRAKAKNTFVSVMIRRPIDSGIPGRAHLSELHGQVLAPDRRFHHCS